MDELEYVQIKLKDIPQELVNEYNLKKKVHNRWVYFEIVKSCYGLPQVGRLTNDLLCERLTKEGYYMRLKPQGCGSTHHTQYNSCLWWLSSLSGFLGELCNTAHCTLLHLFFSGERR